MFCFFFFKQKTAYEMRISDWSSDVCSSDLASTPQPPPFPLQTDASASGPSCACTRRPRGTREGPHMPCGLPHLFRVRGCARRRSVPMQSRILALAVAGILAAPPLAVAEDTAATEHERGRASWWERVCQDV